MSNIDQEVPNNNPYENLNNQDNGKKDYQTLNVENGISDDFKAHIAKQLRIDFVIKVYSLLLIQVIITIAICSFAFNKTVIHYLDNHYWHLIFAIVVYIITMLILMIDKKIAKKVPINYILLFIITVCVSIILMSLIALIDDPISVIKAFIYTLVLVIALTFYAFNTKDDFSILNGFLVVFFFIMMVSFILVIFSFSDDNNLYIMSGILTFSLYILADTYLILGKFGVEISIEDYVFACLTLYIDIVELFVRMLILIIKNKSRRH